MELRAKDSYHTFTFGFVKFDILVVCPSCSKQAFVKGDNYLQIDQSDIKVICPKCGYNKKLLKKTGYVIGRAIDPFFHLPLWLKTDFEEHILWAYNFRHLDFLRQHIEAKLRERNGQEIYNTSLGSRLPKWMTSQKNRNILLKKINELQHR